MSADSFFYAGLAGARADSLTKWKQHAADQEAQIAQLQQALLSWQKEAVMNNSNTIYQEEALLAATGKTADEFYGENAEQKAQEALASSRRAYLRDCNTDPLAG